MHHEIAMQSAPKADEGELLPSWFVPKRFLEEQFDAEAYVADLRRFVSFCMLFLC